MATTFISFIYRPASSNLDTTELLEKEYQKLYKPLAKFLFAHPEFHFTFYFPGNRIQFYKKKRPEFLTLLKQLIERNQIEISGGAYYDPLLPLLFTADRNGQLDLLSAEIRQSLGKRPRGCSLFADCWDSSMVNNLVTCGFEYVFLDSACLPSKKLNLLPLIMSNLGKSIDIFPIYHNFIECTDNFVDDFIQKVEKLNAKLEKKGQVFQQTPDRILCIDLKRSCLESLLNEDKFSELAQKLAESETVKTTIPFTYKKNSGVKESVYVTEAINKSYLQLSDKVNPDDINTFYDLQESFETVKKLFSRILYVGMLVNQYKSDKMRKNSARDKLWQGQNGKGLLTTSAVLRQQSYKLLMEAEKILREDNAFKESLTCFDYNCDGMNEYICRMQNYFACISSVGGSILELDILKNTGNYADNLSNGNYKRGLFVDHIFTESQFEDYKKGIPAGDGIFSRVQYNQIKFSQSHHELQLGANALFGSSKQKIYLRKKFLINSTGMIIQYILRNESEKPLNAIFALESNIAHTKYNPDSLVYYNLETATDDQKCVIDTSKSLLEQNGNQFLSDIDSIRLSDTEGCISFTFEPNEKSHYIYYPLVSEFNNSPVHLSFVSTMFWNVSIEPGKEIEKTINFTITNLKKERKPKITQ
ncbi:alpha-amylase/4-alpha-glucanotransferase domain-containing protein [Treponema sp. C6A8]|uniref:alpha-amylase/4-alpha-glucanotransferase domain-containing protein n=1 Tax=Treponema sp. C6A8 TaxID=1410609 RepID=UPI000483B891|nr:alpha-amylase/4-alpha-glucanotransferase domain-containing protein [Treponema sp. C6A8]